MPEAMDATEWSDRVEYSYRKMDAAKEMGTTCPPYSELCCGEMEVAGGGNA
jgi:hypothetical protein